VDACSEAAFEGQWLEKAAGVADVFDTTIREAGVKGAYRIVDRTSINRIPLQVRWVSLSRTNGMRA
jgi:hypothetical protein